MGITLKYFKFETNYKKTAWLFRCTITQCQVVFLFRLNADIKFF